MRIQSAMNNEHPFEMHFFNWAHLIFGYVEFLRGLGSQSGVSVWQHTLVGRGGKVFYKAAVVAAAQLMWCLSWVGSTFTLVY